MAEQAPIEEVHLTSRPIEVPSMLAWRWRVERLMRESDLAQYSEHPSADLGEKHAYFFEQWGRHESRGWDVRFDPTEESEMSVYTEEDTLVDIYPTLRDLLDTNYPDFKMEPFQPGADFLEVKGFTIHDPRGFINTLAANVKTLRYRSRSRTAFAPLHQGLTLALAKTQDGSIYRETDQDTHLSRPTNIVPSFTSVLETAGAAMPNHAEILAEYICTLRQAPLSQIADRARLHHQFQAVLAETFEKPAGWPVAKLTNPSEAEIVAHYTTEE